MIYKYPSPPPPPKVPNFNPFRSTMAISKIAVIFHFPVDRNDEFQS